MDDCRNDIICLWMSKICARVLRISHVNCVMQFFAQTVASILNTPCVTDLHISFQYNCRSEHKTQSFNYLIDKISHLNLVLHFSSIQLDCETRSLFTIRFASIISRFKYYVLDYDSKNRKDFWRLANNVTHSSLVLKNYSTALPLLY